MTTNPTICPLVELLAAVRTPPPAAPTTQPGSRARGSVPPPPEAPPRLLWTLDDAAARLSVGRTKMYGFLANGLLPSMMLGGRRVIAEQDLVEFVERLRGGWEPWG